MGNTFKYSYKSSERELSALSVYNSGYQKCPPLYQWGPGVRNHRLIHYIISGKGAYICAGKTYELCAGDAFIVFPDTEVVYRADESEPWTYCWVGFSGGSAERILAATEFSREKPVIRPTDGEALRLAIEAIYHARGSGTKSILAMTGALYTALSLLAANSGSAQHTNARTGYARDAITYIERNFSSPVSVEDIAAYVGINRSYLYTAFMESVGTSPKEYLTRYRIGQACRHLRSSAISVASVANSAGFENSMYFSKVFRKIMGMTPTEYANAHLQ